MSISAIQAKIGVLQVQSRAPVKSSPAIRAAKRLVSYESPSMGVFVPVPPKLQKKCAEIIRKENHHGAAAKVINNPAFRHLLPEVRQKLLEFHSTSALRQVPLLSDNMLAKLQVRPSCKL